MWILFSLSVTAAPAPGSHKHGDLGLPVHAGSCSGSVLSLCHVLYCNVSFGTEPVFNKLYLFLNCFLSKYCALTQKWATITAAVSGFLYILSKDPLRNFLVKQMSYQKHLFLPKRAKSSENWVNVQWNSVAVQWDQALEGDLSWLVPAARGTKVIHENLKHKTFIIFALTLSGHTSSFDMFLMDAVAPGAELGWGCL